MHKQFRYCPDNVICFVFFVISAVFKPVEAILAKSVRLDSETRIENPLFLMLSGCPVLKYGAIASSPSGVFMDGLNLAGAEIDITDLKKAEEEE